MRISGYAPALSSSVLCANPTHKYPNCLFKYYLHLQQHTTARAAFQLLYISKPKARNQRKVKDDIRLALSSTKPRIPKLALWLFLSTVAQSTVALTDIKLISYLKLNIFEVFFVVISIT